MGAATYTAEVAGQLIIHLDTIAFDFHMDVAPDASIEWVRGGLAYLDLLGYEPIPLEECDPELLDNDWVRRYFVPIDPIDDAEDVPFIAPPRVGA
ncbi:hypothetical protein ACQPW3_36185 [Actinosynnema sp. CA-248983]